MPRGCSLGQPAAGQLIRAAAGWRAGHDADVLVIAVDGHGAAGKSTIAAAVARVTGAALIHTDDFFGPGSGTGELRISRPAVRAVCGHHLSAYYDWRRLRAEALEPLRTGHTAEFRRFDWERGSGLDGTVSVTPSRLIMLEGVFSAAPELSDLVDKTVFVDTPEAERLQRLHAQITPSEWDDDWLAAQRAYFGLIRPPSSFDLIIGGTCAAAEA
jgi:uridine kinase